LYRGGFFNAMLINLAGYMLQASVVDSPVAAAAAAAAAGLSSEQS
jgi:hypothetical protein